MKTALQALDRVLKGDATRPDSLRNGSIEMPMISLSVLVVVLGAIYGSCMGAFALMVRWGTATRADAYQQMLASAVKVPLLFVLTLLVTLPSLYVFNALVGSKLGFAAVSRLMLAALAVIMAVLASFGTILVFFSLCTDNYSFIVLLNVAMFAVAGLLGMRFLLQTLHRLTVAAWYSSPASCDAGDRPAGNETTPPPLPGALDPVTQDQLFSPQVRRVFRVWIILFGLVGAQMGWVLRPFIGNPNTPFTFFRERQGNFFEAIGRHFGIDWPETRHRRSSGWPRDGTTRHSPIDSPDAAKSAATTTSTTTQRSE